MWESPAVGSSGPNYLNSAALFHTNLQLISIKDRIITPIELQLGRIRSSDKYMDRSIDLDVLIYDSSVIDPGLWSLAHLAVPASELMPDFINKDSGKTLREIAELLLKKVSIIQRLDLNCLLSPQNCKGIAARISYRCEST